jgi:four helix bundle protein
MVRKFIDLAKLLNGYLSHFPRHEKYALCNQIRQRMYDVYGLIVEGQKRYHKKTTLSNLDIAHEQLRMLLFLACELGYFRFKDGRHDDEDAKNREAHRWQAVSRQVDELGRMIGGWIRQERQSAEQKGPST